MLVICSMSFRATLVVVSETLETLLTERTTLESRLIHTGGVKKLTNGHNLRTSTWISTKLARLVTRKSTIENPRKQAKMLA